MTHHLIFNDFNSIKANNEKSLLLLTSIASVENLPSSETTLLKALEYLGYTNQSIHYLVSRKLAGILSLRLTHEVQYQMQGEKKT